MQPMASPRERRRRETALMIQRVTIRLVRAQGLEALTTDAIAQAAGISKRTFFNYYPNKESALLGIAPEFPAQEIAAFQTLPGPPCEVLRRLMRALTMDAQERKEELRLVLPLLATQPRVLEIHMARRESLTGTLAALLSSRYPGSSVLHAPLLAHSLLTMSWLAVQHWLERDLPLEQAFDEAWETLLSVAGLILDAG